MPKSASPPKTWKAAQTNKTKIGTTQASNKSSLTSMLNPTLKTQESLIRISINPTSLTETYRTHTSPIFRCFYNSNSFFINHSRILCNQQFYRSIS